MVGDTNLIIMLTILSIKAMLPQEKGGLAYHNQYGLGQVQKLNSELQAQIILGSDALRYSFNVYS